MHRISLSLLFSLSTLFSFAQNPLFIPDTLSGPVINLNIQNGTRQFYPGNTTNTMGINGNLLAPTLILEKDQQVTMQVSNNISDTTTIHWHGMHVAPENDGGPHIYILPGTTWSPSFKVMDPASTHWYHPHLHHKTYDHVQLGLAGFIIVRDSMEAAINLPRRYGIDDFPLAIQTKGFDVNNQIVTTHTALDTSLMVNGTIRPFLNAPAQVIRLRLLNGSPERVYNLGFSDNRNFQMIGSDGGLLSAPLSMNRLLLAPGERAEILVNLSADNGQSIRLMNYGTQIGNAIYGAAQPGMGPGQTIPGYSTNPLNGSNFDILTFNIGNPTSNPVTTVPTTLISHNPWQASDADTIRSFVFMPSVMGPTAINGPFMINGAHYDMDVINEVVKLDNIEIWELRNQSPIAHPFHIHNVPFYILSVNGAAPPAYLQGKKDVVLVPAGNSTVRFITKFEDFANDTVPYMYHCHMLTHEDDGMMGQFLVKRVCDVSVSNPVNQTVNEGVNVQFSVSISDTAGVTYRWQARQGTIFSDLTEGGQYTGTNTNTLRISNVSANMNGMAYRCLVNHPCRSFISAEAILSVNGDTTLNPADPFLLLYPNPASDLVSISNHPIVQNAYNLIIYDSKGRKISELRKTAGERSFSVKHLPAGVYMIRFISNDVIETRRLIRL